MFAYPVSWRTGVSGVTYNSKLWNVFWIICSNRPGLKQVYVQDSEDGKMLSSVEEVAREHFKQQGYTHGQ